MVTKRSRANPARPFVVAVLLISFLAALSFLRSRPQRNAGPLDTRSLLSALSEDENEHCRQVHTAQDQCAWIKRNCHDEEAGLISYLRLYYCDLGHLKPLAFVIIVCWTGLLFSTIGIAASDFFCVNLSTISNILGMSESMAGVTFLAFGNGSPDVFSTFAAIKSNSGSLAVGELIGAAGFITAVVSGSMALVRPFRVAKRSFVRDVGFFIVAVSFSMIFVANGKLELWESAVMVGFYIFYVMIVVIWHWWLGRRRRQREQQSLARGQYAPLETDEIDFEGEYAVEDNDAPITAALRARPRHASITDFHDLERAGEDDEDEDVDELDEEAERDKWLGELSSNMRIGRPKAGDTSSVFNPIRPSLIGALEFRSVLSSLRKSRNVQSIPFNMRRYSDDPYYTAAQQNDGHSTTSDPYPGSDADHGSDRPRGSDDRFRSEAPGAHEGRARAVSVNAVDQLRPNSTDWDSRNGTRSAQRFASPERISLGEPRIQEQPQWLRDSSTPHIRIDEPLLSESPPTYADDPQKDGPGQERSNTQDFLAPPGHGQPNHGRTRTDSISNESSGDPQSRPTRPKLKLVTRPSQQRTQHRPRATSRVSPRHSPMIRAVGDATMNSASIRLPDSALRPLSASPQPVSQSVEPNVEDSKPVRWWPYRFLPSPDDVTMTLFPTIWNWHEKTYLGQIVGILSAPSFFFLTITLPVVEPQTTEPEPAESASKSNSQRKHLLGPASPDTSYGSTASVAVGTEQQRRKSVRTDSLDPPLLHETPSHTHAAVVSKKEWSRWLVLIQCFTAPALVVLAFWANLEDAEDARDLIRPLLYSLIGSCIALAIVLFTTTSAEPPRWHFLLCLVGFTVSITWISSIAEEVVGVLKAIGVIFNISDAILGLTIFAVGNSLGDLVADVTVARLGYPVMALSACFGGPMLNILLGIGLSGLYITITGAEKRKDKHPDRDWKFKPYHVDVSATLLISAVMLLVTLVGLLIAIPLNKWVMDRKIGWGLIALWVLATAGNLAVELTGVADSMKLS